jgi:O-antigen/teichoic acid export membrane protein
MSAAAESIPLHGLRRRALSLGAAKAFDYAMQFLLPVVLVRCLDAATFGEYRLLWLAVGTLTYVAMFNMPQSLYLFLPRSDARLKRLYINQALIFLGFSGLVCAWAVSPWNPWLPAVLAPLAQYGVLVPAFVVLWMVASLLDVLPTVDEKIVWQSAVSIGLSVLRVLILAAGAFFSGSFHVLLWLLVAFVVFKLALLLGYVRRVHGLHRPVLEAPLFADQVRQAAPIGASNALFGLRSQGDQWIAAHFFALSSFAAFSIAAVLGPLVNVFRASVNEAFLPSMSRLQAAGDARGMAELNSRANVTVGLLLYPMLAFAFLFAEEVVTVIYTAAYVEAAPVMRVYILAFGAMVIEVGSMVLLLSEGKFALRLNIALLAISLGVSLAGAQLFGLPGAAVGSVLAIYLDRVATLRRISKRTGVPLAQLQDWRGLGLAILYGVLAAGTARVLTEAFFARQSEFTRLAAGGTVLVACYAAAFAYVSWRKGVQAQGRLKKEKTA